MCQCRHKTPAILPVLPIRAAVNLGGDAVGFYIFPFHTALSALLRSWNPFRFLRRRIDRVPLLSVLPAKLSSNPRIGSSSAFAANRSASGIAGPITIATRLKPTRCMPKWCWTAGSSGAPSMPIIRRSTGARIPKPLSANRQRQRQLDRQRRVTSLVKNNVALDLKHSSAEVWLVGPDAANLVKNNVAFSEVMVFQRVIPPPTRTL
jgi:hypothetical protein